MSGDAFVHRLIRASAGSGKTHQLTNRYLALLVAGVEPETALATTFTRKAAGEILDRVLSRLAVAAAHQGNAAVLAEQIGAEGMTACDFTCHLGRLLHGLHCVNIGTLDSFYLSLAGRFGPELGLPGGWSIGEEADDADLRTEALERLLERQPEFVGRLLPLLSKGESKRSICGELQEVIDNCYAIYRGTEPVAWQRLQAPLPVPEAVRAKALAQLRRLDPSGCGDQRFVKARDKDVKNFEEEDWGTFIDSGLAAKLAEGQTTYQKKPIPADVQAFYQTLLEHARSQLLGRLAEQTLATRDFLERFHAELWALKQATGILRFDDVTQTLADGLQGAAVSAEALAYRLDGAVAHLLLDEFQDTSFPQWLVLKPLARRITRAAAVPLRSFFCVGDVKQAIYAWRGGLAGIVDTLPRELGELHELPLDVSRRSAPPVIEAVNMVFGHLDHVTSGEKCRDGLRAWHGRFTKHKTAKTDAPGYVCLHTGPAMTDGQSLDAHRISHCRFVAEQIGELAVRARGRSIGVLCRKNDTVARMIYELRRRNVAASEEGGSALTDSAAVEVILSLFALADHPGDSVARFHLLHSPLRPQLETSLADPDALAERFRGELLADGYGPFTYRWAKALAPACDARDLRRLQQLVETAYAFQPRSTLRPGAFAAWVRGQRVADPSGAGVRVLTIHAAKGLEFDAVVLPELDTRLLSQPPAFVIGRDPHSLAPTFVCRYADEALQALMTADEQSAFAQERCRRVEESLSLLYVAMTRAAHALYLYVPGPRKPETGDTWCRLLLQRLAPDQEPTGGSLLTQDGHADWAELLRQPAPSVSVAAFDPPRPIVFRPPPAERRRGLEHVTPSRREGQGRVLLRGLIHPSEGTGTAAGMIYHAWFEAISWLDDGPPTDDELYTAAERKRWDVPVEIWNERVRLLAMFRTWLKNPAITAVFRRSSYAGPRQPGFPKGLAPYWTETTLPKKVERERRFLVRDGTQLWSGSLDRVVWLADGDRTVAADILDFKTDAIAPGDMAALTERIECYRPQLEAYRGAVALLAKLPPDRVSARLVFPMAGEVVPV